LVDGKHISGFAGGGLAEELAHRLAGVLGRGGDNLLVILQVARACGDILGAALLGALLAGGALGLAGF
jgi:hypothetical protein